MAPKDPGRGLVPVCVGGIAVLLGRGMICEARPKGVRFRPRKTDILFRNGPVMGAGWEGAGRRGDFRMIVFRSSWAKGGGRGLEGGGYPEAALSHPNVCSVHETGEECGFLAMEFVEVTALQELAWQCPLPPSEALEIAMQVAQGLQAVHGKGVGAPEHQERRPDGGAGGGGEDHGLWPDVSAGAHTADAERNRAGHAGVSVSGAGRGTAADRRSDRWPLGMALEEMLTGPFPFPWECGAAAAQSILRAEPEPVAPLARRAGAGCGPGDRQGPSRGAARHSSAAGSARGPELESGHDIHARRVYPGSWTGVRRRLARILESGNH